MSTTNSPIAPTRAEVSATIAARFTRAGLHHWPGASGQRAYLANDHRHLFHVEVTIPVDHEDREVEFHDLLDLAAEHFEGLGQPYHPATPLVDFGPQSCETLARRLGEALLQEQGLTNVQVSVSEDGECGAVVTLSSLR